MDGGAIAAVLDPGFLLLTLGSCRDKEMGEWGSKCIETDGGAIAAI